MFVSRDSKEDAGTIIAETCEVLVYPIPSE